MADPQWSIKTILMGQREGGASHFVTCFKGQRAQRWKRMDNRHIDGLGETGRAKGRGGLGNVQLSSGLWVQTEVETQKKQPLAFMTPFWIPCKDSRISLGKGNDLGWLWGEEWLAEECSGRAVCRGSPGLKQKGPLCALGAGQQQKCCSASGLVF